MTALRTYHALWPGSGLPEAATADDAPDLYAGFLDAMPLGNRAEDYAVVLRALALDPDERYPSAAAFARDLVATASGSRTTAASRLDRARHRRRGLGLTLVGALVLLGAAGSLALQRSRAAAEREAERDALQRALEELTRADGPLAAEDEALADLRARAEALGVEL